MAGSDRFPFSLFTFRLTLTRHARGLSFGLPIRLDSISQPVFVFQCTMDNNDSTQTYLSLQILENGFILNPYDEVDEDFLREMNDK